MPEPSPFGELEAVLGYSFRDRGLLEKALRHASYCNEQGRDGGKDAGKDASKDAGKDASKDAGKDASKDAARDGGKDASKDSGRLEDNQRLEFLGDAVLSLLVGQRLMARFPDAHEGDLSVTRAQVVSETPLSDVARQLGFGRHLLLGRGEEKSGGRDKPKILADAFEAIVAAVYLDGGFQAAWDLVERLLTDRINAVEIKNFYDFKTRLQETAHAGTQHMILNHSCDLAGEAAHAET